MSMSTHVIGFRPPDAKWKQMKAVWDSCQAADCPVPKEVQAFFEWLEPADHGVTVDLGQAATKWNADMASGYEVDIRLLPPNVHIIRFYNSY